MDFPPAPSAWLIGIIGAAIVLSLAVYGTLFRRLLACGGRVETSKLGPLDAGLACFFFTWFSLITYSGFTGPERAITNSQIVTGAVHLTFIVLLVGAFLAIRKINPAEQFGLRWRVLFTAPVLAALLLLAAWPLIGIAGALMQKWLGAEAKPQEIVQFFFEASKKGDRKSVFSVVALGVVFAPMAEEFIFRGYLYPVFKKYLGPVAAMILVAALFAAIHLNFASLPPLFILAVCFTLAYETTGSILVPMTMHALFNLAMFGLMLKFPQVPQ